MLVPSIKQRLSEAIPSKAAIFRPYIRSERRFEKTDEGKKIQVNHVFVPALIAPSPTYNSKDWSFKHFDIGIYQYASHIPNEEAERRWKARDFSGITFRTAVYGSSTFATYIMALAHCKEIVAKNEEQ